MSTQDPNKPDKVPQLFSGDAAALQAGSDAAAVARATQEIQAALVIAQRFPRDEVKAIQRITQACGRKGLAADAEYEYSRGGTKITGPTIDLLRAIANRWGNIRFGWVITERKEDSSMIRTYAWDLQSNTQAERTFSVKHWRDTQNGGYALTDERDIYEMQANVAARRVRACLEEVIDGDIVDLAVDECRKTLVRGETVPLRERCAHMLNAFAGEFGVDRAMIEARIGNSIEACTENQFASLRRIFKSLKDGVGRREDYFKAATAPPAFDGTGTPPPGSAPAPGNPPPAPAPSDEDAEAAAGLAPDPQPGTPPAAAANLPPAKPKRAAKTATAAPAPAPAAAASPAPAQTPPAAPAAVPAPSPAPAAVPTASPAIPVPEPLRYVRAIRHLAAAANIPEGKILDFLTAIGLSDGSCATLDELALLNPAGLRKVHDQWADMARRIKLGE